MRITYATVLRLLQRGPCSVEQLCQRAGWSIEGISRTLNIGAMRRMLRAMRKRGLVSSRLDEHEWRIREGKRLCPTCGGRLLVDVSGDRPI